MGVTKSVEEIPEVLAYVQAEAEMRQYMATQAEFMDGLHQRVDNLNALRSQADKIVRSEGVSCGPWDQYQKSTKYVPDVFYDDLGREDYLDVGGTIATEMILKVDKAKIQAAIASGAIPKKTAERGVKITLKYHAPVDMELP